MKYRLLNIICCPACSGRLDLTTDENIKEEIINGVLLCNRCNNQYNIKEGIPDLTVSYVSGLAPASGYNIKDTDITYSLLWKDSEEKADFPDCHYEKMQEVIPENIITGKIGLEVGCGSGVDLWAMAKKCPDTEVVALDISEGVYAAFRLTKELPNVHIVRASALSLPFCNKTFDFCYSYGVIHHTPDPRKCFSEISRVLKDDAKTFLYLYDDHSENFLKRYPLKAVSLIRRITSRMDKRILNYMAIIASPLVFLIFTVPAKIFKRFRLTRRLSDHIPFNFGKGPFSLRGDLYDRFGAPIEFRFNRKNLETMLQKSGFEGIEFSQLKTSAGIVSWAKKAGQN